MISELAIYISLNMVTVGMMAEVFISMRRYGVNHFGRWFVTWIIFALGSLMLGFHLGQWITINLGG